MLPRELADFFKDYIILILQHSDKSLYLDHNINKHVSKINII